MAQVLIRNLNEKTVKALKRRAERGRRSLQEELKGILEAAEREGMVDRVAMARRLRERLEKRGLDFGDSGREQAEARRR